MPDITVGLLHALQHHALWWHSATHRRQTDQMHLHCIVHISACECTMFMSSCLTSWLLFVVPVWVFLFPLHTTHCYSDVLFRLLDSSILSLQSVFRLNLLRRLYGHAQLDREGNLELLSHCRVCH